VQRRDAEPSHDRNGVGINAGTGDNAMSVLILVQVDQCEFSCNVSFSPVGRHGLCGEAVYAYLRAQPF